MFQLKRSGVLIIFLLILLFSCSTRPREKTGKENNEFTLLNLARYSRTELVADFDLLVSSLKEAHTGLYWYSTESEFDSVVAQQKDLIKDSLNGLQFYNIVAPIIAFTKEDHCDISLSDEINQSLLDKGLFLPLCVINLDAKPLLLNNPTSGTNIKGWELYAINGVDIEKIYKKIFNTFASDGFILSSKYRYLDLRGLSREYAYVVGQKKANTITAVNPATQETKVVQLPSVSYKELSNLTQKVLLENNIREEIEKPAQLTFTPDNKAILTFRTFGNSQYRKYNMNFTAFVDSSFAVISKNNSKTLIIDMRDNGGGSEGNEDYLFSYLTDKPYTKYKYVQVSNLTFSFLNYTDYASTEDTQELEEELQAENQKSKDGKFFRRPHLYTPELLKATPFTGQVFILISGWTYSGGAEFSTLMREHTPAVFIGEETGGGYSGNTSGTILSLTLPHTKLTVDIPILKFVLDVKKGKIGHGVIPDYKIQPTFSQFINGYDAELEYAFTLSEQ